MIKLVVCDGDGTLGFPKPPQKIRDLLEKMQELGIGLAIASGSSNEKSIRAKFKAAGLPDPVIIATHADLGVKKPSPRYIEYISQKTNIQPNEMVYLGDDDNTDIFCAINSYVLPFAALYSKDDKPREYGLPVDDPAAFSLYLETYGTQNDPFFGWKVVEPTHQVENYVLIGEHRSIGLTDLLKDLFKLRKDTPIGPKQNPFSTILFHFFLSQSYRSTLIQSFDYVSTYPGHVKDSENEILSKYSGILPKILRRNRYLPQLLIRHTTAVASHISSSIHRDVYDQLSTIHVNPAFKAKIQGKRILILDDFTTTGQSFETSRLMLLKAGAASVVGIAFAKFGFYHRIVSINGNWDPYAPFTLSRTAISHIPVKGIFNPASDDHFSNVIWKRANS